MYFNDTFGIASEMLENSSGESAKLVASGIAVPLPQLGTRHDSLTDGGCQRGSRFTSRVSLRRQSPSAFTQSAACRKWDELLKCKCDIEASLRELPDNRLVWNEARFCFVQERDKNLGGNSLYRSEERIATEKRHLKRKWKSHIRLETYKSLDRTAMDVPRRQSVKL